MTTATFTTVIDQSTDAAFRTWVAEMITQIAGVGCVQTADTGQINTATVTRAAVNTAAGYTIWKFSDSSLFFKLEFGSGTVTTYPLMWITVGTGSNGSGTLTGQLSTRTTICYTGLPPFSTSITYVSYICHTTNAFALAWKVNAPSGSNFPFAFLVIGKTVDGTGAATTTGFGVLLASGSSTGFALQSVRIAATAATYGFVGTTQSPVCIPGAPASSLTAGGNYQSYDLFLNIPDVVPFVWANAVILAEAAKGGTYSVSTVGSVSHTYLSIGQANGSATWYTYAAATYGVGMLWE
jgi:hypothetical protein